MCVIGLGASFRLWLCPCVYVFLVYFDQSLQVVGNFFLESLLLGCLYTQGLYLACAFSFKLESTTTL